MPCFLENVPVSLVTALMCVLLFLNIGPCLTENKHREKRVAILETTEIPAATVDLSQFNFTDLVNGMLSRIVKGSKKFFSFLSVTSYSSFAFHKVSVLIYNISNLKYADYQKFPMRYCYCLNNRTNDLTDYTLLLLDVIGNTTSSLKELFKSTSIVSVSQSNESECIYLCVMTGRTGRNLSDLWEFAGKSPVVNFTVHRNYSSVLDVDSILPNLITSPEYTDLIMKVPSELWTLKTTTGIPLQEMDEEMFTRHAEEIDKPGQRIFPTMVPLDLPAISKMRQEKASTSSEGLISKVQTLLSTQLPPAIQGIASKEHKIFPTKIVETIAQKRPMLSDEVSLQPQNALREYSVSFLGQKTQEVSSLKLPGWTTIAALEMLQRPYTVMPLWTGQTNEIARDSITEKIPATYVDVSPMERGSSPKISSLTKYGRVDAVHTLLKTTPSTQHGIPIEISPLRVDSDLLQKQHDAATVKMLLGTTRGKISTPTATVTSLDSLLPQVKPTTERQKVFVPLYTQSKLDQNHGFDPVRSSSGISLKKKLKSFQRLQRNPVQLVSKGCRHAKLMVTTPPASPVFPKVNSCLMELCRFFQQCLCISQEQYSRHKKKRQCIRYYSWYWKNATYICDKVQRNSHRHNGGNIQGH